MRRCSAVLALALTALALGGSASALNSGDTVTFVVPAGTSITTGPEGDVIIYTGQESSAIDAFGCVFTDTTPRYVQSALAVDPGSGQRPTRLIAIEGADFFGGVITLFTNGAPQASPVESGTRLANLARPIPDQCSIVGQTYDIYTGTVE